MVDMGNNGHVTDVVFVIHNPTKLVGCKLHLQVPLKINKYLSLESTTTTRRQSKRYKQVIRLYHFD